MATIKSKSPNIGDLSAVKRIPYTDVRHFVGDVEYASPSEALVRKGVKEKLGLADDYFMNTPIYSYIKYHRGRFTSYVLVSSRFLFPYSELEMLIDEYFDKNPLPITPEPLSPEVEELLQKLRDKPHLAKTLLELVA